MSDCCHKDTYELPEPWPTGESIEVCNCCGMSRAHYEWDHSPWISVGLYQARRWMMCKVDAILHTARRIHDSEEHY